MTEDDIIVISSDGQLTLTLVSKDHEGEWRCQATNSLGSSEARTRLTVTPGRGNSTMYTYMHACMHLHAYTHLTHATHAYTHTHTDGERPET